MNRAEFQERVNYCKRELDFLMAVEAGCNRCAKFSSSSKKCADFGEVPADFIAIGCDNWIFDDVPF